MYVLTFLANYRSFVVQGAELEIETTKIVGR
jgi:hypothetical protein